MGMEIGAIVTPPVIDPRLAALKHGDGVVLVEQNAPRGETEEILAGRKGAFLEGVAAFIEGCEVIATAMHPEEAFHRAFSYQEFDVTELSLSSTMMTTVVPSVTAVDRDPSVAYEM